MSELVGDSENKPCRECMAEIVEVLKKYDMAGAVTIVTKTHVMSKYDFPAWTTLTIVDNGLRFRAKREDFPSREAQQKAIELSVHVLIEMRDMARDTVVAANRLLRYLANKLHIEHLPGLDDPELDD